MKAEKQKSIEAEEQKSREVEKRQESTEKRTKKRTCRETKKIKQTDSPPFILVIRTILMKSYDNIAFPSKSRLIPQTSHPHHPFLPPPSASVALNLSAAGRRTPPKPRLVSIPLLGQGDRTWNCQDYWFQSKIWEYSAAGVVPSVSSSSKGDMQPM